MRIVKAALLSATMLTPSQVSAGPVLGFIQGAAAVFAGSAVLGGTVATAGFTAGVAAAGLVGSALGSVVGQALLSVGLSYLASRLQARPTAPKPAQRMANFAQAITYAETVYGRVRKGGPYAYSDWSAADDPTTGIGGRKRWVGVILAAHPCEGVFQHYLDERPVTRTVNEMVNTAPMADHYRIAVRLAGPGANLHDDLYDVFDRFTAAHDFEGLTMAHIWAKKPAQDKFSKVYPTGNIGQYLPVLDGKNVIYDPRDGAHKYTNNAALVIADWATVLLGRTVDWAEVAAQADICDQTVINADGVSQPRWTINGVISDDMEFEDQRAQLAAACDAWFYERPDGGVGFRVGAYSEPTITLTDEDFYAIEESQGNWGRNAPSGVSVQYVEPANGYREASSGVYQIDATARRKISEPEVYMVSNHNQASRIAKRIATTSTSPANIEGTLGVSGDLVLGHRFVRIQSAALGSDRVYEVGELIQNEDGFSYTIRANAVAAADFEFDAATEEPSRRDYNHEVREEAVPVPAGLTLEAKSGASFLATWDAQPDNYRQQLEVIKSGDLDGFKRSAEDGDGEVLVAGLDDGETYSVRLRNLTGSNKPSDWSATLSVVVLGNTQAPDPLSAFGVTVAASDITVAFDAPNDGNYYATRIYRADYANGYGGALDFADAVLVRTEYGIPSSGDDWTDTGISAGVYAYWGEPINSSGKGGALSGPASDEIL